MCLLHLQEHIYLEISTSRALLHANISQNYKLLTFSNERSCLITELSSFCIHHVYWVILSINRYLVSLRLNAFCCSGQIFVCINIGGYLCALTSKLKVRNFKTYFIMIYIFKKGMPPQNKNICNLNVVLRTSCFNKFN